MSAASAVARSAVAQRLDALDDLAMDLEGKLHQWWLCWTPDEAARMREQLAAVRWARTELHLRLSPQR